MRYILMQREHEVCAFTYEENGKDYDFITKTELIDRGRLPFSIRFREYIASSFLEQFLKQRCIPEFRIGTDALYGEIGNSRIQNSVRAYGLSLSDCYWVKPENSRVTWDQLNFFKNQFSYDIGNYMFGIEKKGPDILSPDLTTNGMLPKTWRRHHGKICLLKGGRKPECLEPYNEAAASVLLKKLNMVPFVEYSLLTLKGQTVSVCENFLKDGQEYVPASEIFISEPRPGFFSTDDHLCTRCRELKIPGYKDFVDRMRYVDLIIGNSDRHLGNFGFLYDTESMAFTGPAPVFDCGTSFFSSLDVRSPEEAAREFAEKINKPDRLLAAIQKLPVTEILPEIFATSGLDAEDIRDITSEADKRQNAAFEELSKVIQKKKTHNIKKSRTEIER